MIDPNELSQMYPDWDPEKINQVAGLTGYQAPQPAVSPMDVGMSPEPVQPDMRLASNELAPKPVSIAPVDIVADVPASQSKGPMILDASQAAAPPPPSAPIAPPSPLEEGSISNSRSTSTSVQESGVSAPTRRQAAQDIAGAYNQQAASIGMKEQAQAIRNDVNQAKAADVVEQEKSLAAYQAQLEQDYSARRQAAQTRFEQANREAEGGIDPRRVFNKAGTGAKFGIAIFQAMSALGSALARTPNSGLELLKQAMTDDIEAQKAELETKKGKLSIAGKELQEAAQAYGTIPAALTARRAQMERYAIAKYSEAEAKATDLEQKAALARDKSELMKEHQKTIVQFDKETNAHITRSMSTGGTQSVRQSAPDPSKSDKGALFVPALNGYARSEKDAEKIKEKTAQVFTIQDNLDRIAELRKNANINDLKNPKSAVYGELESLSNELLQSFNVLQDQGVISGKDAQMTGAVLGNSRSWFANADSTISALRDRLDNRLKTYGKAYGIRLGSEEYVQTPQGPQPVQVLKGANMVPTRTRKIDSEIK